ncbi:MAG TPA: DUF4149 domain-containing protein [Myxococcota bacterium]|nr:DUF4149 domain-containing protein [Myxococcota bacterium]
MLTHARSALLGVWVGALAALGAVFVPAAFEHLPTALAASVLGEGFAALDRSGAAIGALCAVLGWLDARRRGDAALATRLRALLPLVGVAAHLASGLAVTPRIHALRVAAGGGIGQLPPGDPALAQFARLHAASRGLFGLAVACALGACIWDLLAAHLRVGARVSRDIGPPNFLS